MNSQNYFFYYLYLVNQSHKRVFHPPLILRNLARTALSPMPFRESRPTVILYSSLSYPTRFSSGPLAKIYGSKFCTDCHSKFRHQCTGLPTWLGQLKKIRWITISLYFPHEWNTHMKGAFPQHLWARTEKLGPIGWRGSICWTICKGFGMSRL